MALSDLIGSLPSGGKWWILARRLREIDDAHDWRHHFPTRAAWLEAASQSVGRSSTQLRRYLATLTFIENLAATKRIGSVEAATVLPEATLAAMSRLDRISPAAVDSVLQSLPGEVPSFRSVLAALDKHSAESPEKLGLRESSRRIPQWFVERCFRYLQDHQNEFAAEGAELLKVTHLGPVDVDLVLVDRAGRKAVAIECKLGSLKSPRAASLAPQIAWASRFFYHYWVWLSEDSDLAPEIVRFVDEGDLNNVGIAVLSNSLAVVRPPGAGNTVKRPQNTVLRIVTGKRDTHATKIT